MNMTRPPPYIQPLKGMSASFVFYGGYWNELMLFIRSLFNSTFKTNPYLFRAVMTGITRNGEKIFQHTHIKRLAKPAGTCDKGYIILIFPPFFYKISFIDIKAAALY